MLTGTFSKKVKLYDTGNSLLFLRQLLTVSVSDRGQAIVHRQLSADSPATAYWELFKKGQALRYRQLSAASPPTADRRSVSDRGQATGHRQLSAASPPTADRGSASKKAKLQETGNSLLHYSELFIRTVLRAIIL